MEFRQANISHTDEISQLVYRAFSASEGEAEGSIISNLARDLITKTNENDCYAFIATESNQINGCGIFSRLSFENNVNAFLLGPMAVHPKHQNKGIGQKIINFGLDTLKHNGVEYALTYGDPDYYSKVGFKPISQKLIRAPIELSLPHGWLAQSLVGDEVKHISGPSFCVEALNHPDYW